MSEVSPNGFSVSGWFYSSLRLHMLHMKTVSPCHCVFGVGYSSAVVLLYRFCRFPQIFTYVLTSSVRSRTPDADRLKKNSYQIPEWMWSMQEASNKGMTCAHLTWFKATISSVHCLVWLTVISVTEELHYVTIVKSVISNAIMLNLV